MACVVYSRTRMRRLATPSTTSLLLKRAPAHSCRSATATAPASRTSESFAASGGSGTSPYARSCGVRPERDFGPAYALLGHLEPDDRLRHVIASSSYAPMNRFTYH